MPNNFYGAISLTGGGTGALDAIDGTTLADLDAAFVRTFGVVYHYTLDDDSGAAEDSPNVISPDTNAGTKRWILQSILVDDVTVKGQITLPDTTTSSLGIILKDSDRFLHNFHHPTGGGALPNGFNIFLGKGAGNFTTGATATSVDESSLNVGVGYNNLSALTIGYDNTAIGAQSQEDVTIGHDNTSVGTWSLLDLTTGNNNVAVGSLAMGWAAGAITGSFNTAVGTNALGNITSGDDNIALGFDALFNLSTADFNIAIGSDALYGITTGANNIAIGGVDAGRFITGGAVANETSSESIYIGRNTRASADGNDNEIVIGDSLTGLGSNTVVIGNDSITNTYLKGILGLGTAGSLTGILTLSGSTSGTITLQPAAAAGTYTLTLPTDDGLPGEFLQTNGSGVLDWATGTADAFSSLWYHGAEVTTTISTVSVFTKLTHFVNVGEEDVDSNVVGDPVIDDDITIGANGAGTYMIHLQASFKNASGSNKNLQINPKIILATALTVTGATNATPIVVTVDAAHTLKVGDMVTISGVVGNTAANADHFLSAVTGTTMTLQTLAHADTVGNGAYVSDGTVDALYPGNIMVEGVVSGTDLARGAGSGTTSLAASDVLELHVANITDANNAVFSQVQFGIERIL